MSLHPMKTLSALAVSSMLILAGQANAQSNTTSLAGWATFGDVISQAGAINLTTAYLDGGVDQPYNLSGVSAIDIGALEAAAGVAAYALDLSAAEPATEGSLARQSISVTAGQTLSFDWSFTTHETLFEDRAFAVVDGSVFTLASRSAPGQATQTFHYTATQSGLLSFGVGVVDTVDVDGVSALRVENLVVSSVPEPTAALAVLLGFGLLTGVATRRR